MASSSSWFLFNAVIRLRFLSANAIITLILGTILYCLSYHAIQYTRDYPPSSELVRASWIWHVGTRFMAMWYPLGFFFVYFRRHSKIYIVLFILGCLAGLLISFAFAIILDFYTMSPNAIYEEFTNATRGYVLKHKEMPRWIHFDTDNNCCTWPGGGNIFVNKIQFSKQKFTTRKGFMKDMLDCTGVKPDGIDQISYHEFWGKYEKLKLQGKVHDDCDSYRNVWVKQQHKLMYTSAVLISLFGVLSFVSYIHYHIMHVRRPLVWTLYEEEPNPQLVKVPKAEFLRYEDVKL